MSVTITQFTDPLCTWCWGMEPVRQRIAETYGDQVEEAYVMGGLVEDFESFYDAANDISDPTDVAPHWEAAAARHGMPVDVGVWQSDPPMSSYPASEAFHAARFQGSDVAGQYLRRLREAVAAEGYNVADQSVLVDLATEVGLDREAFEQALNDGSASTAFEKDRAKARQQNTSVFPTFHVEGPSDDRWLRGFLSFAELSEAIESVDPSVEQTDPRPLQAFLADTGRVATQEVAEVYELDRQEAQDRLAGLSAQGDLRRIDCVTGVLWQWSDDVDVQTQRTAVTTNGEGQ